jgi:hypothetical protein
MEEPAHFVYGYTMQGSRITGELLYVGTLPSVKEMLDQLGSQNHFHILHRGTIDQILENTREGDIATGGHCQGRFEYLLKGEIKDEPPHNRAVSSRNESYRTIVLNSRDARKGVKR